MQLSLFVLSALAGVSFAAPLGDLDVALPALPAIAALPALPAVPALPEIQVEAHTELDLALARRGLGDFLTGLLPILGPILGTSKDGQPPYVINLKDILKFLGLDSLLDLGDFPATKIPGGPSLPKVHSLLELLEWLASLGVGDLPQTSPKPKSTSTHKRSLLDALLDLGIDLSNLEINVPVNVDPDLAIL